MNSYREREKSNEKKKILLIYQDIINNYLESDKGNRRRMGLHLTRCSKNDLFGIVYELSKRGFGAKWKNSCESPSEKSQLSKKVRINWTEKRLCYENNEVYQVDVGYMKEREERRGEWTKEFEEKTKKSDKIAYRSPEEAKRLTLRKKVQRINETNLEKALV